MLNDNAFYTLSHACARPLTTPPSRDQVKDSLTVNKIALSAVDCLIGTYMDNPWLGRE